MLKIKFSPVGKSPPSSLFFSLNLDRLLDNWKAMLQLNEWENKDTFTSNADMQMQEEMRFLLLLAWALSHIWEWTTFSSHAKRKGEEGVLFHTILFCMLWDKCALPVLKHLIFPINCKKSMLLSPFYKCGNWRLEN